MKSIETKLAEAIDVMEEFKGIEYDCFYSDEMDKVYVISDWNKVERDFGLETMEELEEKLSSIGVEVDFYDEWILTDEGNWFLLEPINKTSYRYRVSNETGEIKTILADDEDEVSEYISDSQKNTQMISDIVPDDILNRLGYFYKETLEVGFGLGASSISSYEDYKKSRNLSEDTNVIFRRFSVTPFNIKCEVFVQEINKKNIGEYYG